MTKITLKIEGMHCSSCAMNIDFDLEELEGVKTVKTNYAKELCEVEYNEEKVQPEVLIKQIKKTGYNASHL